MLPLDLLVVFPLLAHLPGAWATYSAARPGHGTANPLSGAKVVKLASSSEQLFHEAAVYHVPTKALWVNSDSIEKGNETLRYLQRITGLDSSDTVQIERINSTMPAPVGGFRYISNTPLGDVILFAVQGNLKGSPPGGVWALNPYPPYNQSVVLGSYGDYQYNSPDDVTVGPDGTIFFTDPPYAHVEGGFRPLPMLPNQVYSYNPFTKDNRVVADGFGRPNGIATNLKGDKVYIGDTGASVGNGTTDLQGPRTIYVYDRDGPMLSNRRVFAMPTRAPTGPDGIKVDSKGNVWSGVGPEFGVMVWNSQGTLLGELDLKGTIGNLGFGEPGELFVCGGRYLYKIILSSPITGSNA